MRKLADAKLLSAVELNASEERYRAAEMALLRSANGSIKLEVDGSTARLKLTELQTSLRTLDNESRTAVRNARVQYDQALAGLVQERENVQIQVRALESKIAQASRQVSVSEGRLNLATVTMPVAGTIAELKVKNAGEIVAAGAAIATVVPADAQLFVEAKVTNKDVGFLRPGVEARIKVDAFPFQQFGTARARVTRVLPAVGSNASFVVQLEMLDQKLIVNGTEYNLFPGLAVHVDLITGRRRMLEVLMQRQDGGAPPPSSPTTLETRGGGPASSRRQSAARVPAFSGPLRAGTGGAGGALASCGCSAPVRRWCRRAAAGRASGSCSLATARLLDERHGSITIDTLAAGAVFAHESLLSDQPFPYNAYATSDCTALLLSRAAFEDWLSSRPALLRDMRESASRHRAADVPRRLDARHGARRRARSSRRRPPCASCVWRPASRWSPKGARPPMSTSSAPGDCA